MAQKRIDLLTPVGRLIGGSVSVPETKDYDGKPLTMKDKVTPRVDYSFGVAIPKTPGVAHWGGEAWGAPILALGREVFTNGEAERDDFSWKITDGDSTKANKRNVRPCDKVGYPGNWVIWFSGGFAPTLCSADGSKVLTEPDAIKTGYFVQVFGNVADNKPSSSPGVYINHTHVALAAFGEEISSGPPASAVGFGEGVSLPPGASTTPTAAMLPPSSASVAAPSAQGSNLPPASAPGATTSPSSPPPATTAVAPNPAILAAPPAAVAPAVPAKQMTAKAGKYTYDQYIAQGWTDAQLIAEGLLAS